MLTSPCTLYVRLAAYKSIVCVYVSVVVQIIVYVHNQIALTLNFLKNVTS